MSLLDQVALATLGLGAGLLAYVYAGYPWLVRLAAAAIGRSAGTRGDAGAPAPSLTVLLTVHNEAAKIAARLENLLALDYARDRFDIVVASDGSTDATGDIVRGMAASAPITLVEVARGGKTAAQNAARAHLSGEIVLLTDANTRFAPDFAREICKPFADPRVGCATANLLFGADEGGIAQGQGLHWRQELLTRDAESRLGILAVASGQAMAIRRVVFEAIPEHVGDDCVLPLMAARRGLRSVHCRSARARDEMPAGSRDEFRARVRMTVRNWHGTWLFPDLLNPFRHPGVAWSLWSHKLLKWLGPAWIAAATLAALWLARHPDSRGLPLALFCLYGFGMIGWVGDRSGIRIPLASLVFAFGLANLGFLVGLWQIFRRRRVAAYGPSSSAA